MILYFMRHAEAEEAGPGGDAARPLTERGRERTEQAAAALQAMDLGLGLIVSSPLRRALETAEIVGRALQVEVRQDSLLAGGFDLEGLQALTEMHGVRGSAMLVGHEPSFSAVVGELIGGAQLEMKKGGVACVEAPLAARGAGTLRWLMTGKLLSLRV